MTVCDKTQKSDQDRDFFQCQIFSETGSGTYFGAKFSPRLVWRLFLVPNFSDTGSNSINKNEKFPGPGRHTLRLHDDNGDDDDDNGDDDHNDYDNDDEGARLLHSSTALGIEPDRLLEGVHSSTLCLRWMIMMTKRS